MIKMAWRWLRIGVVALYSLTIWLSRELHPFIIGGYSKHDPRHPAQIQARIVEREHALFPLDHDHDSCPACAKEAEEKREAYLNRLRDMHLWERRTPQPRTYWYCVDCAEDGEVQEGSPDYNAWRTHWTQTGHERFEQGFTTYHRAAEAARSVINREDTP